MRSRGRIVTAADGNAVIGENGGAVGLLAVAAVVPG
jgi:hypothetical protein